MYLIINLCISLVLLMCSGCASRRPVEPNFSSISIVDRNGLSETVSTEDRLCQYENTDFLSNQPYQKVLCVYERDCEGNIKAFVTSYHPNGQPQKYLEIVNARAFGKYQEWYANGVMKLSANIIGGMGDLAPNAEQTWLFDGCNQAWDENGNLIAEIYYEKGELEGESLYYHATGKLWKCIPYCKNVEDGTFKIYTENGDLLQSTDYKQGQKDGCSIRYWCSDKVASNEMYVKGLLQSGQYYDLSGNLIAEVKDGTGNRVLFAKDDLSEMHEYVHGSPSGEIKVFGKGGSLLRVFHIKDNKKHGEEIEYFEIPLLSADKASKPKMSIQWYEGKIQGIVKTWYVDGAVESQREMSNNKKNGLLTAWYKDGNIMMIEEYENDKLVKGDYFKKGDKFAVSQVRGGNGIMTLFDAEGNYIRKATYTQGKPPEI